MRDDSGPALSDDKVLRTANGAPIMEWTQEQIEAALWEYGDGDIDCCIQKMARSLATAIQERDVAQKEVERLTSFSGHQNDVRGALERRNEELERDNALLRETISIGNRLVTEGRQRNEELTALCIEMYHAAPVSLKAFEERIDRALKERT